ncbi:MAG: hypothetical protein PWR10_2336 [Halanaerobiales bacterium]|nr:hypothetical protein [Halanaerobiales bacterium]
MPFGYSKDIFKYPPVQYIPLDPFNDIRGKYPGQLENTRIFVFDHLEEESLHSKLRALQININYNIMEGELVLLVLNGKVNLIQYRGYEVIMVGKRKPGFYQIFKITDQYFYKDRLIFILYNGEDSQKLDWVRYDKLKKI